ncbi:MAG: right-handed parallel beta-helix repeat-containing protein [Oscillospiraceae bacterium]|jgi:hypothetical protein
MKKRICFLLCFLLALQVLSAGALAADTASVLEFGAVGDGLTDDTVSIQKALDSSDNVCIPDGIYLIDADKSLQIRSNQKLTMSENAVLKAIPTSSGRSAVINVSGASSVTITGGQIIGERDGHLGNSGERGMGIQIVYGSKDVTISNVKISGCWGDGLYIGSPTGAADTAVSNITIRNVVSENNRRQGLSITNASYVTIENSEFRNTKGIAPGAGIDIEPNLGQAVEYINIVNTRCSGNAGSGILLAGYKETVRNVSVIGCDCSYNGSNGIYAFNASNINISGGSLAGNEYGFQIERDVSNVNISGMDIYGNYGYGIAIYGNRQIRGIGNITIQDTRVFNNYYIGAIVDNRDMSGYVSDVSFIGCSFYDDQAKRTQKYGLEAGTEGIVDVRLSDDCVFSGNTSGPYKGKVSTFVKCR